MSNNIVRYQPRGVLSLRDAMDRLFEQSFLSPLWGDGGWEQLASPAVDVAETNDDVIVTATVPGIKADDLEITLSGDILHLSGQSAVETERKDATYHLRERRATSFSRAISLPAPVISEQAQAEFENGVLTLKLPKAQEARPKMIKVKSKK
jgi:HSP20 family protein